MKKISVIVQDRNTLILENDAQKGDYIDLTSLSNVDFTHLEKVMNEGKDKIYQQKLEEFNARFSLEKKEEITGLRASYEKQILELNQSIKELKTAQEVSLKLKEQEIDSNYQNIIQELNTKIKVLEQDKDSSLKLKEQELSLNYQKKIEDLLSEIKELKKDKDHALEILKNQLNEQHLKETAELQNKISNYDIQKNAEINTINAKHQLELLQFQTQKEKELKEKQYQIEQEKVQQQLAIKEKEIQCQKDYDELKEEYRKQLEDKDAIIKEKEDAYLNLQRQKASLNVKQTGEDLEAWCDNEVRSYMQNGLYTCSWAKDNKVIYDEGEIKGSKADYIFKVYASEKKAEDELLTSVCLDMKDENPASVNKKKNSDYYKDLDKNRNKKNCKYAILVSNLELDKPNDLPIYKVGEYPDMYVVRPAYMMTFLNMLASLTKRFADLILADNYEKLELKNAQDLLNEFEKLKNTYLDKPLEKLEKDIEEIRKNNENISKASKKIDELCDTITRTYLKGITDKLGNFEIKIKRECKKYEKKEKIEVISH